LRAPQSASSLVNSRREHERHAMNAQNMNAQAHKGARA
jgi:hypothetical protein